MKVFTPTGIETHETCPVCREPDVLVEHGIEVEMKNGAVVDEAGPPQKYWHCPECGDSIVTVIS